MSFCIYELSKRMSLNVVHISKLKRWQYSHYLRINFYIFADESCFLPEIWWRNLQHLTSRWCHCDFMTKSTAFDISMMPLRVLYIIWKLSVNGFSFINCFITLAFVLVPGRGRSFKFALTMSNLMTFIGRGDQNSYERL